MLDCARVFGSQSIAAAQANFVVALLENILLRSQMKRAALRQRLITATVRACKLEAELERNVALDLLMAETAERVNALERLELHNKNWTERVNKIKAQRELNHRAMVR